MRIWTPQRRLRTPWADVITPQQRALVVDRRKLLTGAGVIAAAASLDIASPNVIRAASLAGGQAYPRLPVPIAGVDFIVGRTSNAALTVVTTGNVGTYIAGATYNSGAAQITVSTASNGATYQNLDCRGMNASWLINATNMTFDQCLFDLSAWTDEASQFFNNAGGYYNVTNCTFYGMSTVYTVAYLFGLGMKNCLNNYIDAQPVRFAAIGSLSGQTTTYANNYARVNNTGVDQPFAGAFNDPPYGPPYSYEGCANTTVTGGPYSAGATVLTVADASLLASGTTATITCSDASTFASTFTLSGATATFSTPVPGAKTVNTGAAFKVGVSNLHGDGFQMTGIAASSPIVLSGNHIDVSSRLWDDRAHVGCPATYNGNSAPAFMSITGAGLASNVKVFNNVFRGGGVCMDLRRHGDGSSDNWTGAFASYHDNYLDKSPPETTGYISNTTADATSATGRTPNPMQWYNHFDFWTQSAVSWTYAGGGPYTSVNGPSDLAPPTGLTFTGGSGSITPTFTANGGAFALGTYYSLDGGAISNAAPLTSGTPITGLSAGSHTIQLFTMGGRDDNPTPNAGNPQIAGAGSAIATVTVI